MPHVRICGGPGEVTPLVYPTVWREIDPPAGYEGEIPPPI